MPGIFCLDESVRCIILGREGGGGRDTEYRDCLFAYCCVNRWSGGAVADKRGPGSLWTRHRCYPPRVAMATS